MDDNRIARRPERLDQLRPYPGDFANREPESLKRLGELVAKLQQSRQSGGRVGQPALEAS
jgi:hypothetical protein